MNEIDDLLERIETPHVDVTDDVARGAGALRRRHRWQVSGAAASVAALVTVVVLVQGGNGATVSSAPGFAGGPTGAAGQSADATHHPRVGPPPTRIQRLEHRLTREMKSPDSQSTLGTYHDVLAEHLDPTGTKLRLAQNSQGGGGSFGTKLDWNGGGMLEIVVGRSWGAVGGFYDLAVARMQDTTFQGDQARVSTSGDDLVVSVRHDDGTVVSLVASSSFGNNGTSTADLGLDRHQLLEAAADPRLVLPAELPGHHS